MESECTEFIDARLERYRLSGDGMRRVGPGGFPGNQIQWTARSSLGKVYGAVIA